MKELYVIATSNPGKVKEFANQLGSDFYEIKSLSDIGFNEKIEETGSSFQENASIKANAVCEFLEKKGIVATVIADDSGLEVEALDGAPGVYSARYAGDDASDQENYELLLSRLKGNLNRNARFACVLCVQKVNESPIYFEGECKGIIIETPRGSEGFGYDPIFIPESNDRTFAEMTIAEKKALSHRGHAIKKLIEALKLSPN